MSKIILRILLNGTDPFLNQFNIRIITYTLLGLHEKSNLLWLLYSLWFVVLGFAVTFNIPAEIRYSVPGFRLGGNIYSISKSQAEDRSNVLQKALVMSADLHILIKTLFYPLHIVLFNRVGGI